MAEALSELAALLGPAAGTGPGAAAARAGAAEAALSLSGSAEGRRLLAAHPAALAALLELAAGPRPCPAAGRCLLNVAAEPQARGPLLAALPALLGLLPAGPACGALANLCREPLGARRVLRGLEESGRGLEPLLRPLGEPRPPPELGPLLCNLSQVPEGRRALLDRSRCGGGARCSSCCPSRSTGTRPATGAASWARSATAASSTSTTSGCWATRWTSCPSCSCLSRAPRSSPRMRWKVSGARSGRWAGGRGLPAPRPPEAASPPGLPVDLQYLPPDKQREEEPDIRKMLLEAIMLLTATKAGRHTVREKGTYLVLRELHHWEREPDVLAACEKLIQVLIGDEPGPGMENLLEVSIPEEVEQQLQRLDQEEEERWQREREERRKEQEQDKAQEQHEAREQHQEPWR